MVKPTAAKKVSSNARDWAEDFALLGNPVRLEVLELLANGAKNTGALAQTLGMSVPALAHHLTRMQLRGLVTSKRLGREVVYRANPLVLKGLEVVLKRLRPNR